VIWILDHRRDVMADLRVLAHVSWREALAWPAPEFLAVVSRLTAYPGVMAARFAEQERPTRHARTGAKVIPSTRAALMSNRDLAGVVSFGKG
jgi:hypothetical protein